MMFNAQQILDSVKSMKVAGSHTDLSHCQYLRHSARLLGFPSYEALKAYLESPPLDRAGKIYTGLMRKICSVRLPSIEKSYIRMTSYDDLSIGYDSYWIGWDRCGREVRVPREGFDKDSVINFRGFVQNPIYVVESERELWAWQFLWRSDAAIPVGLAKAHFGSFFNKKHLVAADPPIELIKKRIQKDMERRGLI
jgi:hypothetical protein